MSQGSIEIQGQGATPFDMNNENLVINAFSAAMTSVSRADFTVRYFTSDSAKVPSFSSRRLLATASLLPDILPICLLTTPNPTTSAF